MSSACVCHLNEWCFYCEMYSPLEERHEKLKIRLRAIIQSDRESDQKVSEIKGMLEVIEK